MSRCLVIFHKQLGDLVLLESALRCLAHANGRAVDLITRSGLQPLGSLMPHVNFRSKPNVKIYDTLWCFDDRRKSAFYSLLSRAREKHLLISPGASIQWYHSRIFRTIHAPNLGRSHISEYYWKHTLGDNRGAFSHLNSDPHQRNGLIPFHLPITCTSIPPPDGKVRIGLQKDGR